MKKFVRILALILALSAVVACASLPAFAADGNTEEIVEAAASDATAVKAIVAAAIIVAGAGVGAVCMAIAIKKAIDSTARQPEAGGDIRSTMMLGLVFVETAIIYALIIAILVIFVM